SYDTKVRIFMVTRVYLVRAILNQQQAGAVDSGVARLGLTPDTSPSASDKAGVANSPADANGSEAALAKRLDEVEKQLASLQKGAAASYRSQFGREILLDQKFPRPVAIGYRHVTFEPKAADAAN
ncbi:MAG TPA: hypothetical protein VMV45_14930, partial [Casimicrobiaceae bacterium]|nr:hypothetical protein [Casimicrobiaceae bacterium]